MLMDSSDDFVLPGIAIFTWVVLSVVVGIYHVWTHREVVRLIIQRCNRGIRARVPVQLFFDNPTTGIVFLAS